MDVLTPDIRGVQTRGPAPRVREKAVGLWRLIRPQQWLKNLFVVPIGLLDATVWSPSAVIGVGWAIALFVVVSSAVYVVNDVIDRRADRLHPVKRSRPVASGSVSVRTAILLAAVLLALAVAIAALRPLADAWPALVYVVLNAGYSLGLKRIAIVDITIVASGFALRYVQGSIAADGTATAFLAVCIFAACLMFVIGKRRHEISIPGTGHRSALAGYSVPFLDQLIGLAAVTTLLAYALYVREVAATGVPGVLVLLSAPLVVVLVVRYLQLVLVKNKGGDPSKDIASDRVTLVVGALCGVLLVVSAALP